MKAFAQLYDAIDASTKTNAKIAAMVHYFRTQPHADCAWAVYVLAHGTSKRVMSSTRLRALAQEAADVPQWLFEASYQMAGDLAETIAHLVPAGPAQPGDAVKPAAQKEHFSQEDLLNFWFETRILPLRELDEATQRERVLEDFARLRPSERFLYVKLIGGGLRVGVAKGLVIRALAQAFELDSNVVAQRMMGFTSISRTPCAADFAALTAGQNDSTDAASGAPYPFYLAQAVKDDVAAQCGAVTDWQIEWKWDGIRAQVVKRKAEAFLWSRGEELVNEAFPEVVAALTALPDGSVIDGELLVWHNEGPAPFAQLQKRLGRKRVTKATLAALPAVFIAYDCLEYEGRDLRPRPLSERRAALEALAGTAADIKLSPRLTPLTWDAATALRAGARAQRAEGVMLKRNDSVYGVGRTGNGWLKWKLDPYAVDAVLTYAQRGHGRRAGLYTDYTFGVWTRRPKDADECARALSMPPAQAAEAGLPTLVTFAKAYSGLTDDEIKRVDKIIQSTTLEDFGPVRAVKPTLVFELGFEGIAKSARHKSGVAVRFPCILRIRDDKPLHEADALASLQQWIHDHT